jgi:outer membrane protein OmpA-like peptidoglycan-associated protein
MQAGADLAVMIDSDQTPRYRLRCRKQGCGHDLRIFGLDCKKCGFIAGWVCATDPATGDYVAVCEGCQRSSATEYRPESCGVCGTRKPGWWDAQNSGWYQPDLKPAAVGQGVWISGDFEGELGGRPSSNNRNAGLRLNARLFTARFLRGILKNVRREEGPPLALEPLEEAPLRSDSASDVRVFFGASEASFATVTLRDVRLHHWQEIALMEFNDAAFAACRVAGRAYAFLPRAPEKEEIKPEEVLHPHTNAEIAPSVLPLRTDAAPASPLTTWSTQPVKPPEIPEPSAGTPRQLPQETTSCPSCSWRLQIILAIFTILACGWVKALLAVLVLARLVCWVDALNERQQRKFMAPGLALMAVPLLLSLSGGGLLLVGNFSSECPPPWGWALLLVLAALFLGTLFRACWLRVVLLLLWVLALQLQCSRPTLPCIPHAPSSQTAWPGDLSPLPPIANPPAAQPPSPLEPASVPIADVPKPVQSGEGLINKLKLDSAKVVGWLKDKLYFDPNSGAVNDLLQNAPDGSRISLDMALAKPKLLSDCKTSIYFPNENMFDLDSDQINPLAQAQLMKINRLRTYFPDRDFVITGHADKLGNDTSDGIFNNIKLSERRAAAVAVWLSENTLWGLENIEAQGAGSKFPIVDLPGEVALNRRVEIRLRCKP